MPDLAESIKKLQDFEQGSLKVRLAKLEAESNSMNQYNVKSLASNNKIDDTLLHLAITLKKAVGQINADIHAIGIVLLLPQILQRGEVIESLSLGAGNTGKKFDLETNLSIAEFKFIHWKGGAEAIRQNSLFKDFFCLAEADTNKRRCLYVLGLEYPLKFLNGDRAINSVLSRNNKLLNDFKKRYGTQFSKVFEYYSYRKRLVEIIDINRIMPS